MPRPESPTFAIDIGNWKGRTRNQVHQDIASVALEAAADKPLSQRVNSVILEASAFGGLIKEKPANAEDIATKKIFLWAEKDIPATEIWTKSSPPGEKELLNSLCSFADLNPETVMVWLSPPIEKKYDEARLVIYQTIKVNGQKYLFFRAICSKHTTEECFEIARKLRPFVSPKEAPTLIANGEQLTATPLPILIPEKQSFSGFFRQFINLPEVWKAIAEGKDLKGKIEALEKTRGIVNSHYQSIIQANTFRQQWSIGAEIEQLIQREMQLTLRSGPCGELYSNLTSTSIFGIFGVEINAQNLPVSLGSEGGKMIRNCGACGKALNRYMKKGDRCPHCHGVYEGC